MRKTATRPILTRCCMVPDAFSFGWSTFYGIRKPEDLNPLQLQNVVFIVRLLLLMTTMIVSGFRLRPHDTNEVVCDGQKIPGKQVVPVARVSYIKGEYFHDLILVRRDSHEELGLETKIFAVLVLGTRTVLCEIVEMSHEAILAPVSSRLRVLPLSTEGTDINLYAGK